MTKARASGLNYDVNIVNYYGTANAMFDKTMTEAVRGTWTQEKMDTRDLLGAAVEIKTTFANFLDYWPEYGLITSTSNNIVTLTNSLPYRVGDIVKLSANGYSNATITYINLDSNVVLDKAMVKYLYLGNRDASPNGITFKPDGSKFYFIGATNDRVFEYNLTTPYDISTGIYSQNVSITARETNATGLQFNDSGNTMYIIGSTQDNIVQYALSTPWNVVTATYTASFNVSIYEGTSTGLSFAPDGSNVYFIGSGSDKIFQANLATPWDITTASYKQNLAIGTQETNSGDLFFKPDGTSLYLTGFTSDKVLQYNLSNAWDISTAVYVSNTFIGTFDVSPTMLAFSQLGDTVYFGGTNFDNVYQVSLSVPWDISTIDYSLPVGQPLYILNPQADTSSYLVDNYKIDQLESLSEHVATFGLVSWLQYFKIVTPKRKFYKNTCQWQYKGPECQYPGPGVNIPIPGTTPTKYANTNPIAANNAIASSAAGDVCAKSLLACTLRNNQIHFGGFPGVGRTVPQM